MKSYILILLFIFGCSTNSSINSIDDKKTESNYLPSWLIVDDLPGSSIALSADIFDLSMWCDSTKSWVIHDTSHGSLLVAFGNAGRLAPWYTVETYAVTPVYYDDSIVIIDTCMYFYRMFWCIVK
jgi:hypothetical protein